jgi:DNA-binding transcriptional LysR family regulator
MRRLPDLEGLAIFAKVAQVHSFAGAAAELNLSKATVSKAVSRLEARLKVRLFNRSSRQLSLTEAGNRLVGRAASLLSEAEAAEDDALGHSSAPRGVVRLAAPISFSVLHIAPVLPELFAKYPEIILELQMSDAVTDLVGEGFDAAIRIAALPDSSLVARTLCPMPIFLVGAPAYFQKYGKPRHPLQLAEHQCVAYVNGKTIQSWRFTSGTGETASVKPAGCLRTNNGDVTLPLLRAGLALGILPEFFIRDDLVNGQLEAILPAWSLPTAAVHWVTPARGMRPKRVEVVAEFFAEKLANIHTPRSPATAAKTRRNKT